MFSLAPIVPMYNYNNDRNFIATCILYIIINPIIKLFGSFFDNVSETTNNFKNDLEEPEQYIHSSFPSTPSFVLTEGEFDTTMKMGPNYTQDIVPKQCTCFGCKYNLKEKRFHTDYGGCMYDGMEF